MKCYSLLLPHAHGSKTGHNWSVLHNNVENNFLKVLIIIGSNVKSTLNIFNCVLIDVNFSGRLLLKEGLLEEKSVFRNTFSKSRFPMSTTDISINGERFLRG